MADFNTSEVPEAVSEIKRLATGDTFPFSALIDGINEPETYYAASPLAFTIRILRCDRRHAGERPAFIQFYDLEGGLLGELTRYIERFAMFSTKFTSDVNRGTLFKLLRKPSFIANPNITRFNQIIPDSHFTISGLLGIEPLKFVSDPAREEGNSDQADHGYDRYS